MYVLGDSVRIGICEDIGDGEATACFTHLKDSSGNWEKNCVVKPLNIQGTANKIMSTVWYHGRNNSAVDVGMDGKDAQNNDGVICANFKRPPEEWNQHCCTVNGKKKTYKDVMYDFIQMTFTSILESGYNQQLKEIELTRDQVALFVGCPSSPKWTATKNREAYEELIRDATGVAEVHVVPESTAAVFSAVAKSCQDGEESNIWEINPNKGILILDFGSSTADCTYLLMGRKLLERSWTLGASAIEKNMVWKVKEKNKVDDQRIGNDGFASLYLQCRENIKEAWFGDGHSSGIKDRKNAAQNMTLSYTAHDEYGDVIFEEEDGEYYPSREVMEIGIDSDFMDSAINDTPVPNVTKNGASPVHGSWSKLCKAFITECQNMLHNNQLSCGTVIVTGGASQMDFVMDLVKSVFNNQIQNDGLQVYRDESPSFCVSHGLCQVAFNNARLPELIEKEQAAVKTALDQYVADYKTAAKTKVTQEIMRCIMEELNTAQTNITIGALNKGIQNRLQKNGLNGQNWLSSVVKKPMEDFCENINGKISQIAEEDASKLYKSAVKNIIVPKFNFGKTGALLQNINLNNIQLKAQFFTSVSQKIGNFFRGIKDFFTDNDGVQTEDQQIINVERIATKLQKEKHRAKLQTSIEQGISDTIVSEMMVQQFGRDCKGLHDLVKGYVEEAIEVVALVRFD